MGIIEALYVASFTMVVVFSVLAIIFFLINVFSKALTVIESQNKS